MASAACIWRTGVCRFVAEYLYILTLYNNRVICKVRKTQHQKNPEFGHTQGEIRKKTCKKVH
jgi:hypothetical protein